MTVGQEEPRALPADRQVQIVDLINESGVVSVEALASRLGVSLATIRRDLQHLGNQGVLNRVHGGASIGVMPFASRAQAQVPEKTRIANLAASLPQPGESIAFEGGTTVLAVMSHVQVTGVAVVTNSIDVVMAAQGRPGMRVIVSGGTYDPGTHSMYGQLTESFFRDHRVDRLFIGAGSLGPEGLRDSNMDAIAAKRAAIESAREVVVVADSSKFQLNALALVCSWDRVQRLVTDRGADVATLAALRETGVEVLIA
jgi:DeoR/GlpR family transcriptional regulator of sugar metabolism